MSRKQAGAVFGSGTAGKNVKFTTGNQVGNGALNDADIESTTGSAGKVATHAALDVAAGVHPNAKTHIDAAAPHSGHDTPGARDTAIGTHAALDVAAGVHPNAKTHIDAAAPHSGHDTPGARDTAIGTHAALDVAAGVHPNAKTHIDAAAPHSGHDVSNNNTYSGNNTTNKAVAHGLGRIPKGGILIYAQGYGLTGIITPNGTLVTSAGTVYTQTAIDSTNFYVGTAGGGTGMMNETGYTYRFIAWG